jgi:hypothetical protein
MSHLTPASDRWIRRPLELGHCYVLPLCQPGTYRQPAEEICFKKSANRRPVPASSVMCMWVSFQSKG